MLKVPPPGPIINDPASTAGPVERAFPAVSDPGATGLSSFFLQLLENRERKTTAHRRRRDG
jgi:hypothetical protein